MDVDWNEVRKGMAETRKFVLSHHTPAEFYRCYAPVVLGRRVRLCARCSGIYPGIVAGLLAQFVVSPSFTGVLVLVLLPFPALVDWALTTFTSRRGYNVVRTTTGALLGFGYGTGIVLLFFERELLVLAVGGAYALVAGVLIYISNRI